jgi:hypothetical protein
MGTVADALAAVNAVNEKRRTVEYVLTTLKNISAYYFTGNDVPEAFTRKEAQALFGRFLSKERDNMKKRLDKEEADITALEVAHVTHQG